MTKIFIPESIKHAHLILVNILQTIFKTTEYT